MYPNERFNSINNDRRVHFNEYYSNSNNTKSNIKKISYGNLTVYDAYYVLHTYITKELSKSERFSNITNEQEIISLFVKNNLIDEFREKQFRIHYSIVLYPKLYKFIVLLYGNDKIDKDIIHGINNYNNDYDYDIMYESKIRTQHINIIYKIGYEPLIKWFKQGKLKKEKIYKYFQSKNLSYMLD